MATAAASIRKQTIVDELRARGCRTSYRTKADAHDALDRLTWFQRFPWHDEQRLVLDAFETLEWKELVVQGIFGNGKTTLMLGLFYTIWYHRIAPIENIVMCAFNVCIKNELVRRLRASGIKKRPMIRTFDSMVYTACRALGCPDLDKPDYEGRRRFLEQALIGVTGTGTNPFPELATRSWVFVDETQDLDGRCYSMLRSFFPNARFVFFGDVFQCIQKEPRMSLLWKLLHDPPSPLRKRFWMKKTPRVPPRVLDEIRSALTAHYPDHTDLFRQWVSLNPIDTPDAMIRWRPFRSYQQMFEDSLSFIQDHGPKNVMILVFSSAITVRGGLGDVARFRNFYESKGLAVNPNYKRMEDDRLFLSTVNSSKGLERPFVLLVLTFPLELAFANFSNDLVVNLVSVGLSRCKRHVVFYAPIYKDRRSHVMDLYPASPRATDPCPTFLGGGKKERTTLPPLPVPKAQDGKYTVLDKSVASFFEQTHSATEILRQGIISYTTRLECMKCVTPSLSTTLFPGIEVGGLQAWRSEMARSVPREDQKALIGILVEHLLCCAWNRQWPPDRDLGGVDDNPLAGHCRAAHWERSRQYFRLARSTPYAAASPAQIVRILYPFSQCRLMAENRVLVRFSEETLASLTSWYTRVAHTLYHPPDPESSLRVQHNLCMPVATGIADAYLPCYPMLVEIKGSVTSDWHEDALWQAFLYWVMAGKCSGTLVLLNPVRNERREYRVRIPRFYTLRHNLIREILLWNTNCFLAKISGVSPILRSHQPTLVIVRSAGVGTTVLDWLAPTHARLLFHGYHNNPGAVSHKPSLQSSLKEDDIKDRVGKLRAWFHETHRILDVPVAPNMMMTLHPSTPPRSIDSLLEEMDYRSPNPSSFGVPFHDSFMMACVIVMFLSHSPLYYDYVLMP